MAIPEKPISRIEHYLARANGQNVQPPDPISRVEHYLAGIAGGVPQELLDDVAELKSQLETKAEIDGYYHDMTVGDAEQLISTQYVEDTEPYLYRTTGGTADVGNREYVRAITGGTVAWNQHRADGIPALVQSQYADMTIEDGVATITVTNQNASAQFYIVQSGYSRDHNLMGHVLLATQDIKITSQNANSRLQMGYAAWSGYEGVIVDTNAWARISLMAKMDSSPRSVNIYYNYGGSALLAVGDTIEVKNINLFDLTQMFGSTIADYIYQLEQTTAGAGVAFFRKLFPLDYYPYDAGSLKSVEGLTAHEMIGFNQWDEEWELGVYDVSTGQKATSQTQIRSKNFIQVLPNTTYYCFTSSNTNAYIKVLYYDANKNFISAPSSFHNNTVTTPQNAHFVTFYMNSNYGTTYNHDICINLSWSGTRNGEYEPYVKHSYALDDSLTLRGILKLSDDGKLMYDGDRYLPDGTVERRYGVVDLGTLNWVEQSTSVFRTPKPSDAKVGYTAICQKYKFCGPGQPNDKEMTSGGSAAYIIVQDTEYTTVAAFMAAMSGVMLVYELDTPTTETATPYPEVQLCDDWGTERFVTDSIVPVGTETDYPANLRDKLQHLPDLASADGYYAIKQVGTQMTLEPFRIPKAPTTDGTYTLRATVSGGIPTYTWEQEVVVTASEEA